MFWGHFIRIKLQEKININKITEKKRVREFEHDGNTRLREGMLIVDVQLSVAVMR